MKLLFIWASFPPESVAGALRGYHLCKGLAELGHEVHVITKNIYNPKSLLRLVSRGNAMKASPNDFPFPNNVYIHRVFGTGVPRFLPSAAGYYFGFMSRARSLLRKHKFDCMYASSPPPIDIIVAHRLKQEFGVPLITEFRDPWVRLVDVKRTTGYCNKNSCLGSFYLKLEQKICKNSDLIITTNQSIIDELRLKHKLENKNLEIIFNGVDLSVFNGSADKYDKFTLVQAGAIYLSRGYDALVEAASLLKGKMEFQILLIGTGPYVSALKKLIVSKNLQDVVKLVGFKVGGDLYFSMQKADVLIVGTSNAPHQKYRLPFRTFESIATGKPILAYGPIGGDLHKFVDEQKCGIFVVPTPKELAEGVLKLYNYVALRKTLGKNGRIAAKNYTWEHHVRRVNELITRIENAS